MRKGKKTIKPRTTTAAQPAVSAQPAPSTVRSGPADKAPADKAIVFSASRDAITLSGGKVSDWASRDGGLTASQDKPGAMPSFDARSHAITFDNAFLSAGMPQALENAAGLTVAIGFKVHDTKVSSPACVVSKGSYDSEVLYVDIHEGNLRVKLGDSRLERIPLDGLDNTWIDLVLFTSDGALHVVLNGKHQALGEVTAIGRNGDPLLFGARTQNGVMHCFLDGSIRYVRLEAADSTAEKALDLQSSLTGVVA